MAGAQVGITKADLEEARLQLDYTQVKSPINGLVDRNLVDLGTLVGAQDKTLLTTVVNDESVYVYFNISENDLLMVMRNYGSQRDPELRHKPQIPCSLALADETDFARKGKIDFVGTEVPVGPSHCSSGAGRPISRSVKFLRPTDRETESAGRQV